MEKMDFTIVLCATIEVQKNIEYYLEMKAQKLKTFSDFLKRTELIPHALLVITENASEDCEKCHHGAQVFKLRHTFL